MRNYVIINGINSLTIQGLAIKTLPPITKPIQRNLREEIDGRDGDIVTTLGYGAYDKTIEIGLFGTFDIDEVIAYFNQKGTITFSNEADKVYYFEALDQVDYAELLKFRTANVVLHCQPFKYPVTETPLEEEYEYVTATGTNVTLDNTSEAIFNKIDLLGNTGQNGTPTPSSPIPVNVVSGDNTIDICGKNLYGNALLTNNTGTSNFTIVTDSSDKLEIQGVSGYYSGIYKKYQLQANTTYTISLKNSYVGAKSQARIGYKLGNECDSIANNNQDGAKNVATTITSLSFTTDNTGLVAIAFYCNWATSVGNVIYNDIQIELGSTTTTYEPYIGNSYPIYLGVENSWKSSDALQGPYNANAYLLNTRIAWYGKQVVSGDTLTVKCNNSNLQFTLGRTTMNTNNSSNVESQDTGWKTGEFTLTYNGSGYAFIGISKTDNTSVSISELTDNDFEISYNGNHISSTPIELCKIGTYQDYIYKDNGSWYLHKEIGKVVLNGSENWNNDGGTQGTDYRHNIYYASRMSIPVAKGTNGTYLSNYFATRNVSSDVGELGTFYMSNTWLVFPDKNKTYDLADFKTWLSNNNTTVYYVLATPTNTEITDTTLIEQLEAIKNAISYNGQTNISQTNNDLPFVLDLSALKENSDHLIIDNIGNIYSKPTLDLKGTGIVDIYLNDTQMFEVDLSEKNEIVIDTEKMEAYNPTDNTLANRQVTGDYSKFKLDSGENDLRFSGDLTKATITRYERWL